MSYAELEIGLSSLDQAGQYQVELRFDTPKDDAERTPVRGVAALDPLDARWSSRTRPGTRTASRSPRACSQTRSVRATSTGEFKAAVEGADDFLRVKLFVDRSAPELHRLRWELLTDPDDRSAARDLGEDPVLPVRLQQRLASRPPAGRRPS